MYQAVLIIFISIAQ